MSRVEHRFVLWPGTSSEVPFATPDLDTARKMAEPWADEEHEIQSRTVTDWHRAFLPYVEPTCPDCTAVPLWGLAPVSHPRLIAGQKADSQGIVHDPVVHAEDCPTLRASQKDGGDA